MLDLLFRVNDESVVGLLAFGPFHFDGASVGRNNLITAALANLDVIEREDLIGNARRTGSYLPRGRY